MQPMCAKITFVLRHDYPGQVCSLAKSLEVIGERWSLLIVRDVMNGNRRFSGSRRSLGVARNVLSARLQRLIDEDILERRAYQESPPRHEYFLTEKGLDLWPALIALMHWGDRYSAGPEGPPLLDRPQGVRRRGLRPRHLRTLRRGPRTPATPASVPGPGWAAAASRDAAVSRASGRAADLRRSRCSSSTISLVFRSARRRASSRSGGRATRRGPAAPDVSRPRVASASPRSPASRSISPRMSKCAERRCRR